MPLSILENLVFKNKNFKEEKLTRAEYESCQFLNCIFYEADVSMNIFTECSFEQCDLSMSNVTNTSFKDVFFKDCKMVGIQFNHCNPFLLEMNFEDCNLHLSSFYKLNLKNTSFKNCNLSENDFVETNLTNANFEKSELLGAIFENTILEKSDFRSARNYTIDPETNRIKKAKFSREGIEGLLFRHQIEIY